MREGSEEGESGEEPTTEERMARPTLRGVESGEAGEEPLSSGHLPLEVPPFWTQRVKVEGEGEGGGERRKVPSVV